VGLVSPLAAEKVCIEFMQELWQIMLRLGKEGGGTMMFEVYARALIAKEKTEFRCRKCVGARDGKEIYNQTFCQGAGWL
jgi:hypothetical protein